MGRAHTKPGVRDFDLPHGNADVFNRVRAEYLEQPGMTLTPRQVQRLCGIDETLCQAVLDALVDARFLCVKAAGSYTRLTDRDTTWPGGLAGGRPRS
jgi:hypothetical protein